MNRPVYDGCPPPAVNLVNEYVSFLAQGEPDNTKAINNLNLDDPIRSSLLIGRAARYIADGNGRRAESDLDEAQSRMRIWNQCHNPRVADMRFVAGRLILIAEMIADRTNPDAAQIYQATAHEQVVEELTYANRMLIDAKLSIYAVRELCGDRSQNNVLASLTRIAHPWILAVPALPHHDRSLLTKNNYDIALIESGPATPVAGSHRVQVKGPCLSLCASRGSTTDAHNNVEKRYAQNIILISEECDLLGDGRHSRLQALKLVREMHGKASPEVVTELDNQTHQLIWNITNAPDGRRGRKRVAPQKPYQAERRGTLYLPALARLALVEQVGA